VGFCGTAFEGTVTGGAGSLPDRLIGVKVSLVFKCGGGLELALERVRGRAPVILMFEGIWGEAPSVLDGILIVELAAAFAFLGRLTERPFVP
jgi:hypothetical protein